MQPIFDSEGLTVAWLNDNNVIHDLDGDAIAFVRGNIVHDCGGAQLGWLVNGYFRDGDGDALAFMQGCVGGPLPPPPELAPLPPLPVLPPLPPLPALAGLQPLFSLDWSGLTWDQFMELE
jgi:hypothetical protein